MRRADLHDEAAVGAATYQLNGRGDLRLVFRHTVFLAGYGTLGFLVEGQLFLSFSQGAGQLSDVQAWTVRTLGGKRTGPRWRGTLWTYLPRRQPDGQATAD